MPQVAAVSLVVFLFASSILGAADIAARAQSAPSGTVKVTVTATVEDFVTAEDCGGYGNNCIVSAVDDVQWTSSGYATVSADGQVEGSLQSEIVVSADGPMGCAATMWASLTADVTGSVGASGAGALFLSATELDPGPYSGNFWVDENYSTGAGQCEALPSNVISMSYFQSFGQVNSSLLSSVQIPTAVGDSQVTNLFFSSTQYITGTPPSVSLPETTTVNLQLVMTRTGSFLSTATDSSGTISPPVDVVAPNTISFSDGSSIDLQSGTLAWTSPGDFILNCIQSCGEDLFNFLQGSYGTEVQVGGDDGTAITAVRGANFSLTYGAAGTTVDVYDGVVLVSALNSSASTLLEGSQGAYSQAVTLSGNDTYTQIQSNVTTSYQTQPSTCPTGTVLLDSGQPIAGNLTGTQGIQVCVAAGEVTTLQFSVPPSLQSETSLYSTLSNSSSLGIVVSDNGGKNSGDLFLTGVPSQMPISLAGTSGNDLVSVAFNNTGSSTARVLFQLQFLKNSSQPSTSTTSTTNEQTSSTAASTSKSASSTTQTTPESSSTVSTASKGGGVPEFPFQASAALALSVLLAASYLIVRRRAALTYRAQTD
jgi:hypothetical protein